MFDKEPLPKDGEPSDTITLLLDYWGKWSLIVGFLVLQIGTLVPILSRFYFAVNVNCNPSLYQVPQPLKDVGIPIDYIGGLYIAVGISIVLKFTSFAAMWLALEQYMNLVENSGYFLTAISCALAPTALVAPLFTYNHEACLNANFVLT